MLLGRPWIVVSLCDLFLRGVSNWEQSFGGAARSGHTPNAKVVMPQDGKWGPGQGKAADNPHPKFSRGVSDRLLVFAGWHSDVSPHLLLREPVFSSLCNLLFECDPPIRPLTTRDSTSRTPKGRSGLTRVVRWASSATSASTRIPLGTAGPPTCPCLTYAEGRLAWCVFRSLLFCVWLFVGAQSGQISCAAGPSIWWV